MTILLWILQVVIALFCVSGAGWRMANYAEAAPQIASVGALPYAAWVVIGIFEIVCALGLIVPAFLKKGRVVGMAAAALAVEQVLVSVLHVKFYGIQMGPENPAMWTIMLAVMSAIVAWGRWKARPL